MSSTTTGNVWSGVKGSWLVSLDPKKTSALAVDGPLLKYLHDQGFPADKYTAAFAEINNLRESLRTSADKTEGQVGTFLRYVALLSSLQRRVPISEQEIRLQFTWHDSLKGKKTSQYNPQFEKVNVLFNLAALLSQLGTLENRATDEGIKAAAKFFQMSVGALAKVKEELEKAPTAAEGLDLHPDALACFSHLLLAQAQECFYEKASKGGMAAGVLSKLAVQVALYLEQAQTLSNGAQLKGAVNKKWPQYFENKIAIYRAIGHYHLGVEKFASDAYGEQVARCGLAYKLLEDQKKKKILPELNDFVGQISAIVTKAFASAQKDNNQVYHEIVPSESKLVPLSGKPMVKGIDLDPTRLSLSASADPFEELVPFYVRQRESVYSERKAELLREVGKVVEEQNNLAKTLLNCLGLPGALEALESPTGIPPALQHNMATVRQEGGVKMLKEQIELLDKVATQDEILLKEATEILDAEEKEDVQMRAQYSNRWNRTPSHALTANLRQEAQKSVAHVTHARKSDEFVKHKLAASAEAMAKLAWPAEKILAELPVDSTPATQAGSAVALRQLLIQLQTILHNREVQVQKLRDVANKDELTQKLLQTAEAEVESLFAVEMVKYQDHQDLLQVSYAEQASLLKQIQEENVNFVKARGANPSGELRQEALQTFSNSFKTYTELKSHLKEGIQFYTKFQELLEKFKGKCADYAFARKTEKTDLLADLQSQATGMVSAGSTAAPSGAPGSSPFNLAGLGGTSLGLSPSNSPVLGGGSVQMIASPVTGGPVMVQPVPGSAVMGQQPIPGLPAYVQGSAHPGAPPAYGGAPPAYGQAHGNVPGHFTSPPPVYMAQGQPGQPVAMGGPMGGPPVYMAPAQAQPGQLRGNQPPAPVYFYPSGSNPPPMY